MNSFNTLARTLRKAIPLIHQNKEPKYTTSILMTYAVLWDNREHFDHLDECSSLKSLYRTTLATIAGGVLHPENQDRLIQWTIANSDPYTAQKLPEDIFHASVHMNGMMECLWEIGYQDNDANEPIGPKLYFGLKDTDKDTPPQPRCRGCEALDNDEGGENQMEHMGYGGCLSEYSN